MLLPETAFETAKRIPEAVNTLVDRAKHVAIVKGLNKNLLLELAHVFMSSRKAENHTMLRQILRSIGNASELPNGISN
jgi:hypothetical protein